MKPEETKTFLELAAANPIEATLIIIGTLVLVALFAGAKKVGETIAVGPKAVRGGLAAIGILAAIVVVFAWNGGESRSVSADTKGQESERLRKALEDFNKRLDEIREN